MPASELTLVMPADSRFISTARAAAASLAAELDFSIDEIEELHMGANELVALLTDLANEHDIPTLSLRFVVEDAAIEVHGSLDASTSVEVEVELELELDVLACQILDTVVDSYAFLGSTAHIVKRRAVV